MELTKLIKLMEGETGQLLRSRLLDLPNTPVRPVSHGRLHPPGFRTCDLPPATGRLGPWHVWPGSKGRGPAPAESAPRFRLGGALMPLPPPKSIAFAVEDDGGPYNLQ
ncbi:hypothetical protein N7462_004559 [Penicillium macrosclerotiorum]|uniref:uncharacterized protein n=1 Tax=Penicillium macrosclerotiorum TaxID=303699 RepID=UPI0025491BAD|nr:uncharacterized protein N7462_004559 [Penicillium macrosclerotiorum]KAJ5690167.1 hypothetical protein N7462_004559 [Penicillium macrosclerotiorum]